MSEKEVNDSSDDINVEGDRSVEKVKKPKLSFGITQILGDRTRSRSSSPASSINGTSDDKCDSDNEREISDNGRSRSTSPVTSPTLSTSKYDEAFAHAQGIYPLDLATGTLLPLGGCGLYRSAHGVVKVPAQRPHPMIHMFNPYSIPWIDFRRDRFGGGHASSMFLKILISNACKVLMYKTFLTFYFLNFCR